MRKNLFKSTLIRINFFYYILEFLKYILEISIYLSFSHSEKKELFPRQRLPQRRV